MDKPGFCLVFTAMREQDDEGGHVTAQKRMRIVVAGVELGDTQRGVF